MINIVYCFDENVIDYFRVSLCSLLLHKNDSTHYNISCICTEEALSQYDSFKTLVDEIDLKSNICFVKSINDYSTGFEIRNITKATYFRFDIAELFPNTEKAIYIDVDTLIMSDLKELWLSDIGDNFFLGVKADVNIYESWFNKRNKYSYWTVLDGWRGNYVNAGVLLFNLNKIRSTQIYKKWRDEIGKEYFYQDQDILNITCNPYIGCLPIKFNFMTFYTDSDFEKLNYQNIYSIEEIKQAYNHPAIIHYAGKKPWKDLDTKMGELWWNFVLNCSYTKYIFEEKYKELNKIHVSVIIPAYNVEKYIEECLDSILVQDSENYEIICIDDGSTDRTRMIIEEYKNRFYNMVFIVQEHQGLSVARNSGLKVARGKYVYFVDADDIVVADFISKAFSISEKEKTDVLMFSFDNLCEDSMMQKKYEKQINKIKRQNDFLEVTDGLDMMYKQLQVDEYYPMVWIQFVNRKILVDNFILFYRDIVFEDVLYTYRLLLKSNRVKCIKDIGYIKRIHSESICGRDENLTNVISLWKNLKKMISINRTLLPLNEYELYVMQAMTEKAKNQFVRHYERLSVSDKKKFMDNIGFDKSLLEIFIL